MKDFFEQSRALWNPNEQAAAEFAKPPVVAGPTKIEHSQEPKQEWQYMEPNGKLRNISREEFLEKVRNAPVPIYWYDPEYKAGKCHVRMPDGSIKDVTPR